MRDEKDGKPFLPIHLMKKKKTAALMLMNPETMIIEKWLNINGKYNAVDVNLTKTVPITNSEFIDSDNKVITTMTGYEGIMGYTLYDFKSQTSKNF